MKKLLPILLIGHMSHLAADTALDTATQNRRISELEDRYATHIERITPPTSPRDGSRWGLSLSGSALYWTARLGSLSYAQSGNGTLGTTVTPGRNYTVDWGYDPGFKAGIGIVTGYDGWDLLLDYTWLRSSATGSASGDLVPVTSFPTSSLVKATSSYTHYLNALNFEIGRSYFISPKLVMRPAAGLKGAWCTDRITNQYLRTSSDTYLYDASEFDGQHDWGIGIRGAFGTSWHLTDSFSIVGDVALSAIWSQFKLTHRATSTDQATGTVTTFEYIRQGFHTVRPVTELDIGFKWEQWYLNHRFHIAVDVKWETQVWFDNTYIIRGDRQTESYNLTTQGLTAGLRLDF